MRIMRLAALLLCLQAPHAYAKDETCGQFAKELGWSGPENCLCGNTLRRHEVFKTEQHTSLPMIAACVYEDSEKNLLGRFVYAGRMTIEGSIVRSESDSLGDQVEFHASEEQVSKLPLALHSLRMNDKIIRLARIPALRDFNDCREAPATIQLRRLLVTLGPGTDNDGSFPVSWSLRRVGKFKKCSW